MRVPEFRDKKGQEKLTMITCYEAWAAQIVEQTSVDSILVGDSLQMVMFGDDSTLNATVSLMARHTQAVAKFAPSKLIIGDLPFLSYRLDRKTNVLSAGKLMRAGAHAVKLEGARGNLELVQHLVDSGIPVMGHLGLTPQSVNQLGGYKVQGRRSEEGERILKDALDLEKAGAFSVVLECVPKQLAADITRQLKIPTIGIGAGDETDGQVLVWHDLLGFQTSFKPKFVRRYLNGAELVKDAVEKYSQDVKQGEFPTAKEWFE
ncbi:MAG: 3-methyl-2-oxobutanoate hydroxymethyltransferase [Bdellovibrionaceae bacterium]|nr:3-methyl-2-oxobutanoate hydroxymethyltransferase [Pseudobdellovibrionaceae bacterium]